MSGLRVKELLADACQRLSPGSDSPRLDAELLLGHAAGWSRARLVVEQATAVSAAVGETFQGLIDRRSRGEPVAYILGEKEFWSLPLAVSPAVLVPRPDTEALVERALVLLEGVAQPDVADLGTGSGAIALALATERPDAQILATDLSDEALAVAQGNARSLKLRNVSFQLGDWFEALAPAVKRDLIASNPPYIDEADPHLAGLACEPRGALVADDAGMACLNRLVDQAPEYLKPGGWLLLEHGWQQGPEVRARLQQRGYRSVGSDHDYGGNERVSYGCWHG